MQRNLKKMWPAAATSLIAFTSLVNADTDSAQMRNLENRVNALEQRRGACGMINPPARPQVKDGADLFVFGELLYWNAHEEGLPVAVLQKGSTVNLSKAQVKNVSHDWDFGFRVGLGYNMPHDGWDLSLAWLRFNTDGDKTVHTNSSEVIFSTRAHPADPLASSTTAVASFSKAKSHYRLRLNQLDLDLGREFFVSKWLTLRPHFGLRADWVRQKWDIKYKNSNLVGVGFPNEADVKYKDRWVGMGLEGGLDTQWGLGCGWSIFGDLTAGIVYGFHRLGFKDTDTPNQLTDTSGVYANVSERLRVSHAILDLMLGLRYDAMFNCDRFHLGLQIGWEHHAYINQNQFPVFVNAIALGTNVANQGDLTLQGWTLGARIDF
jgi:hypothetical protein